MYTEKRKISRDEESKIVFIVNIILIVIFVFLLFSFWNLQILKNEHYKFLSSRNIIKDIEIKAPRGFITDKNGVVLAENRLSFDLFVIRDYIADMDRTINEAVKLTGLNEETINNRIDKYRKFPGSYNIPLKRNLSFKNVIYIESRSDDFPEFRIEQEPARFYPFGKIASHIIGYLSEISQNEYMGLKEKGYKLGDMAGRSGIEKTYEKFLKGKHGVKTVIKDNLGQIHNIIDIEEPKIGDTVSLTIDIALQQYIEELYGDYNGAAGVVDLKTGGMLAMVSKPNFDPGFFSESFKKEEWNNLINDDSKPLNNRFIQGLYSPGSTFKIVMAIAGLSENIINTNSGVTCYGSAKVYDRVFHCWNRLGHGWMNLQEAIQNSCNIFFYQLGKKIDIDVIAKYGEYFGLKEKTLIDIPHEKTGILPTRKWKRKNYNQDWYPGETISVAIGGGMITVTPAQILAMISTVALRGKRPKFHLFKNNKRDKKILKEYTPEFYSVNIEKRIFENVIKGLFMGVNEEGTGRGARVEGLNVCGKTGTQLILSLENPNYKKLVKQRRFTPHSWFVSFAPRENPEYAVMVFVENGGDAGKIAAPMAGKIYRRIFGYE
ncbi:MAG: penicillin-binding protein 2 [Acidobacteriota bacterium]